MLVIKPVSAGRERYWLDGPGAGHWQGVGAGALGLEGDVGRRALRDVLAGEPLGRVSARRRGGFDLIIATPKSVSLLAALAEPAAAAAIVAAHEAAILDTLGYLERHGAMARRSEGGRRTLVAAEGLVAAVFRHRDNRAGQPHLHSHVVVANLAACGGRWSSLDSRALFRHGWAAGAVYQASLRHQLGARGFALSWQGHGEGLADVAGVPRAAIDACSTRRTRVPSRRRPGPVAGWADAATSAGFGVVEARQLLRAAAPGARRGGGPEPEDGVMAELVERGGLSFSFAEAVRAAASSAVDGASAAEVERRAASFVRHAVAVDGAGELQRWSTAGQLALERRLVEAAVAQRGHGLTAGAVSPALIEAALRERPGLPTAGAGAVRRLLAGGEGVAVMTSPSRLAMAQIVEAAGAAWLAGFHRVGLVAPSAPEQARWQTLTGVEGGVRAPTIVVVAGAERLPARDLAAVLDRARRERSKVVLLDTACRPRNRAVRALGDQLGRVDPGLPGLEPHPVSVRSAVVVAPSVGDALAVLARDGQRRRQPVVAAGLDEVGALNDAGRALAQAAGRLRGPMVEFHGRPFQVGDRVLALRGDRSLVVVAGQLGTVTVVDPGAPGLAVRWDAGREMRLPTAFLKQGRLAHGYATTPAYAPAGATLELGRSHIVAATPAPRPGGAGPAARRAAALDPPLEMPSGRADLHRSLADLARERHQLDAQLAGPDGTLPRRADAQRWADLGAAMAAREAALGAAALRRPSRAVTAELGPPPPPGDERRLPWCRAAAAIEAHRERFDLPDRPLELHPMARDPERAAAELAVAAACRSAGRDHGRGLA